MHFFGLKCSIFCHHMHSQNYQTDFLKNSPKKCKQIICQFWPILAYFGPLAPCWVPMAMYDTCPVYHYVVLTE
jgi:hypothetical protein